MILVEISNNLTTIELMINLILFSIIPSLICLFLIERVKGKVKSNFDKKLEELRKEHNKEIASFQLEIESIKNKENFKFTKLHEKRFEILENIYMKLEDVNHLLEKYVSPIKLYKGDFTVFEASELEEYSKAHYELNRFYCKNRIYLTDEIKTYISIFLNNSTEISRNYTEYLYLKNNGVTGKVLAESSFKAMTSHKDLPEKISPIMNEIELEFKKILEK